MPKSFSLKTMLLLTAVFAVSLSFAVPAYLRSISPSLTGLRWTTDGSDLALPAVSMILFSTEYPEYCERILLLHRGTKTADLPYWFAPKQNEDGRPFFERPFKVMINGERIYPRDDSYLIVIHATDEDDPAFKRVPRSNYTSLDSNEPAVLWENLVEKSVGFNGSK